MRDFCAAIFGLGERKEKEQQAEDDSSPAVSRAYTVPIFEDEPRNEETNITVYVTAVSLFLFFFFFC